MFAAASEPMGALVRALARATGLCPVLIGVRGAHLNGGVEGKEAQGNGGGGATRVGGAQAIERRARLDAPRKHDGAKGGAGP